MFLKKYKFSKLLCMLISFVYYFFKKENNLKISIKKETRFQFYFIKDLENIQFDSIIIVDYVIREKHPYIIKKCLQHKNVGFLLINTFEKALICNKLGFNKYNEVYYYNKNIDYIKTDLFFVLDMYILAKIFKLRKNLIDIGCKKMIPIFLEIALKNTICAF